MNRNGNGNNRLLYHQHRCAMCKIISTSDRVYIGCGGRGIQRDDRRRDTPRPEVGVPRNRSTPSKETSVFAQPSSVDDSFVCAPHAINGKKQRTPIGIDPKYNQQGPNINPRAGWSFLIQTRHDWGETHPLGQDLKGPWTRQLVDQGDLRHAILELVWLPKLDPLQIERAEAPAAVRRSKFRVRFDEAVQL
eukprot:326575-Rhodomonas_salina.3